MFPCAVPSLSIWVSLPFPSEAGGRWRASACPRLPARLFGWRSQTGRPPDPDDLSTFTLTHFLRNFLQKNPAAQSLRRSAETPPRTIETTFFLNLVAGNQVDLRQTAAFLPPCFSRNDAVGPGGTADPAVLGGNLPPSRTHDGRSPFSACVVRTTVGRVARQNRPVARSTRSSTASFRLSVRAPDIARAIQRCPISSSDMN